MLRVVVGSIVLAMLAAMPCWAGEEIGLSGKLTDLPVYSAGEAKAAGGDWLVQPVRRRARVYRGERSDEIVMANGLISRTFRVAPNGATVAFDNLMTGEAILRAVRPEARLTIDGATYDVGGLVGQPDHAYLPDEWLDAMTADPAAMRLVDFEVGQPRERFGWKRVRYHAPDVQWPPEGCRLRLDFAPPDVPARDLKVSVHYEMYDGIPAVSKWLTLENGSRKAVRVDSLTTEILAAVEYESLVGPAERMQLPNLHVESDYEFHGDSPANANEVVHWIPDAQYTTQVNYGLQSPVLLECRPRLGPSAVVGPGETFESFRVFELAYDSTERERKGLALRRMYRTLAPWATENPIIMHSRQADPEAVKLCIDQCLEVGFEMVILSFGSGLDMESTDPAYRAQIRELVDYAHSKGIEIGGYSLLASRSVGPDDDVVNPDTGRTDGAFFGHSPCLMSRWGETYLENTASFIEETGFDLLEHDGSYPGDVCASTTHPGHEGLADSQWKQWRSITDFYKWCRARGTYLNVPDWYFLNGSTKSAMGYRETNWSLPRDWQIIHGRQNIYDGTWEKTPSMGWMFLPLVEYQGGGAAATLEPLSEHLDAYEAHLAQNLGSGVQACYRGPRLFDTEETKNVLRKWVDFYKEYRDILDSDIIHIRRPDGRHIDAMLHVNPRLEHKGLALVWNPLGHAVETTVRLPLYYTGLIDVARIRERDGRATTYRLDRDYSVEVPVSIGERSLTWLVIE